MREERNPVRVAVVGITVLVAMMMLALNFGRLPLVGGGTTYRAAFADAAGLAEGEEVRVAGIRVGTVTGIELVGDHVEVEFQVKGTDLGRSTTAGIEVKTLLGQHYLSLTPSGSGKLDEDAVIPLERTSTPLNIVPAFQQLTEQSADIDSKQVAEAFDSLSSVLRTTAPELQGTLRGLSRLSQAVSSRDDEIKELLSHANEVTGAVAARDREVAQLVGASNTVLEILASRRATIAQIIDGTIALSRQLKGLVEDNRATLGPALTKLNSVLAVLRANEKQLDETIKWTTVYAREFVSVGGTGHWFDAGLKFPRNFAACLNSGDPIAQLLAPLLSKANQQVNGSPEPCLPLGPATGGGQ